MVITSMNKADNPNKILTGFFAWVLHFFLQSSEKVLNRFWQRLWWSFWQGSVLDLKRFWQISYNLLKTCLLNTCWFQNLPIFSLRWWWKNIWSVRITPFVNQKTVSLCINWSHIMYSSMSMFLFLHQLLFANWPAYLEIQPPVLYTVGF